MPHLLGDGRWWDASTAIYGDGKGRAVHVLPTAEKVPSLRMTKVVLPTVHRDHDATSNRESNLAAFVQRCPTMHDGLSTNGGACARRFGLGRLRNCSAGHTQARMPIRFHLIDYIRPVKPRLHRAEFNNLLTIHGYGPLTLKD